jgi:superfamily I DNA/RNA helicase
MAEPHEIPPLIRHDGSSFAEVVGEFTAQLKALGTAERIQYRNRNATDIATHHADRLLVVAGPGAGKSYLFMARIRHWLQHHPEGRVHVASFVRKLVADLKRDVESSDLLAEDKRRVEVTTIHAAARSLLERNHGTEAVRFRPNIRVISADWEELIWADTLQFIAEADHAEHTVDANKRQHYTREFVDDADWGELRGAYYRLTQYLNAVGFSDMIVHATEAARENPALVTEDLWIIDEYQDLNPAEDALVEVITEHATGQLKAGDDEQALYEQLKQSLPEIIIGHYDGGQYVNAMLPFSSRCSYYITLAASGFISQHRAVGAIDKIYVPLVVDEEAKRVQIIGAATPATAVDFIRRFLDAHGDDLQAYADRMKAGDETDPYLLILSPDGNAAHLGACSTELLELIEPWAVAGPRHSADYKLTAAYAGVSWHPLDNFGVRKLLDFERMLVEDVHPLLRQGVEEGTPLAEMDDERVAAALQRAHAVRELLESDLDRAEVAGRLADLLPIRDAARLGGELAEDPIGNKSIEVQDELELQSSRPSAAPVELLTIVGSKGLSAQHVIVLGCDQTNMAQLSPLAFFVALTRARRSLHMITAAQAKGASHPCGFVSQLPAEFCEYFIHTKGKGGSHLAGAADFHRYFDRLAYAKKKAAEKRAGTRRNPAKRAQKRQR